MPFGAPESISQRPCPSHDLLTLEGRLFKDSCEVRDLEGDEAQQVVADCLGAKDFELASDHAVNAIKPTPDFYRHSDHFAHSEEVQRDRSRL